MVSHAALSLYSRLVEYDPGDAVGFPAEMTLGEAVSCWKQDMAYLQTLLDTTGAARVGKWPTIRHDGEELPNWEICRMAGPSS